MSGSPSALPMSVVGADYSGRGVRAFRRAQAIGEQKAGQGEPGRVLALGQHERSSPQLWLPAVFQAIADDRPYVGGYGVGAVCRTCSPGCRPGQRKQIRLECLAGLVRAPGANADASVAIAAALYVMNLGAPHKGPRVDSYLPQPRPHVSHPVVNPSRSACRLPTYLPMARAATGVVRDVH
jgi:hypothetical protein